MRIFQKKYNLTLAPTTPQTTTALSLAHINQYSIQTTNTTELKVTVYGSNDPTINAMEVSASEIKHWTIVKQEEALATGSIISFVDVAYNWVKIKVESTAGESIVVQVVGKGV